VLSKRFALEDAKNLYMGIVRKCAKQIEQRAGLKANRKSFQRKRPQSFAVKKGVVKMTKNKVGTFFAEENANSLVRTKI
jgi:hypothetical protein